MVSPNNPGAVVSPNKRRIVFANERRMVSLNEGGTVSPNMQPSPEGLKAEMAGEWDKAIEVYKAVLTQDPQRIDLWLRVSDIEASRGNHKEAAAAVKRAADLAPGDAKLYFRLSQAYSVAGQPELALEAVERSVEFEPNNVEYLKARAETANWLGKSAIAAESYEQIMALAPNDDSALLNFARSSAWSGRLDKAVCAYKRYVEKHPEDKDAYIEYAKTEAWRGDYHASLKILEDYRKKFGETKEYLQQKARVLAWARRPTKAIELITPLLVDEPDNYEVNYSRTIALHYDNRPREAVESLDKLSQLRPDSEETKDIRRFVLTPLRSNVSLTSQFYSDSDDLDRFHNSIRGVYVLQPETQLEVGAQTDYLHADRGSGLENIDGSEHAWHHRGWVGFDHRFSPEVDVDGYLGVADAEDKTRPAYGVGLDYQPLDNLYLRAARDYDFYVISPRSVSLGVRRGANRLLSVWEPHLLCTVVTELGYDDFSDDNNRWGATLAPRRSVLRSENFNIDLGVRGDWYGFEDDFDHGYYDPELYQSYMATGFGYWKISDDDGVSVALDAGAIKDDTMDNFRFGWGTNVEGTFGLYRDVMLKLGGGVSRNSRQEGGAFRAFNVYAALTFRF
jgi:tetratricopeptide (TPR) repeat protein